MTETEELLIIKRFGPDYDYYDIPAYIRKRDKMVPPKDFSARLREGLSPKLKLF